MLWMFISILSIFRVVKIFVILMKKNIFFQNKFVMHVLYFLLKKLMEPPFSEYLVLLKNRVTFSYSFILFSYREFYADQKCSGCLFSILSIFRVVKIFVILMKKIFFFRINLSCMFYIFS
jgi:hypothetical protein